MPGQCKAQAEQLQDSAYLAEQARKKAERESYGVSGAEPRCYAGSAAKDIAADEKVLGCS